jgi:hypothetical protein
MARVCILFSPKLVSRFANLCYRNYGKGRALFTGILTLKNGKITAQVD